MVFGWATAAATAAAAAITHSFGVRNPEALLLSHADIAPSCQINPGPASPRLPPPLSVTSGTRGVYRARTAEEV